MANDLGSFIKRNKIYLKLGDGESVIGVYRGYVISADPRDPSKEKAIYKIQPEGYDKALFLSSASVKLAETMAEISEGEPIKITRHGVEKATTYQLESIE